MRLNKYTGRFVIVILILFFHFLLLNRFKFTAWPEMLLWPYLMLKGWLPYQDIAIAHTPALLFVLKAFFGLFGAGVVQLKVFTWSLILINDLMLYWVASKIWNKKVAILSLAFYCGLMIIYEGNGLWFDLALTPLFLLFFYFVRKGKMLSAGIFGTLAFLTKQTAAWLILPVAVEIVGNFKSFSERKKQIMPRLEKLIAGASVVFAIFLIYGSLLGILDDFWGWAIKFGIFYLPKAEGQASLPGLISFLKALLPFTILFFDKGLLSWVFAGSLAVFPRWELFHFQPALPFLAYSFSLVFLSSKAKWQKFPAAFILSLTFVILVNRLMTNWGKETTYFEAEVIEVADYVKEITSKDEKILVLNSWDHFNVLTNTLPAERPWIPQLPWYLKLPGVEENIYKQLVIDPPGIIIFHPYSVSGLDSYRPQKIADFVERYYYTDKDFGNFRVLKQR